MQSKGLVMMRVLLNRYHRANPAGLLKCLPQEERDAIQNLDLTSVDVTTALLQPMDLIQKIHYSWLIPSIKRLPQHLHEPLLRAFPEPSSSKIKAALGVAVPTENKALAKPIKAFLLNKLYALVKPPAVLPPSFLPPTPLSALIDLTKAQLVELIDFLGVHDLADEMRYIIDKKLLEKLFVGLTAHQKQFLRQCVRHQEKITSSRLELDQWDGTPEKLNTLLHRRGLLRLGKALCGQHPDLLWHLSHLLDSGRGEILMKHFSSEITPGITPALVQQVINAMNFLQPKSPT